MIANWVASGRMVIDGNALEYACHGPPPLAAPTIVLLHEGLGCVELWRDFPRKLARNTGFGVLAYSRAGYGQSEPAELPRPLDYMKIEARNVLPRVLDAVGFRTGVLAGHSDGATIAAIYGGTVPDERVRGLVLMAPHFFAEQIGLEEISKAKLAFETSGLRDKMAKYHRDPDNAFRGWNESWLHPEFRNWNVEDVVDTIQVPVLAIQGLEDQYGTLAQIDAIVQRCPTRVETVILDDCQHSPHLEQPERVVSVISDFCGKLEIGEAVQPLVS